VHHGRSRTRAETGPRAALDTCGHSAHAVTACKLQAVITRKLQAVITCKLQAVITCKLQAVITRKLHAVVARKLQAVITRKLHAAVAHSPETAPEEFCRAAGREQGARLWLPEHLAACHIFCQLFCIRSAGSGSLECELVRAKRLSSCALRPSKALSPGFPAAKPG